MPAVIQELLNPNLTRLGLPSIFERPVFPVGNYLAVIRPVLGYYELIPNCCNVEFTN